MMMRRIFSRACAARRAPTAVALAAGALLLGSPTLANDTDLFCPAGAAVFADHKLDVKKSEIHGGAVHDWTYVGTNRDAKVHGPAMIHGDLVAGGKVKMKHDAVVTGSVVEHAPKVVLAEVDDLVAAHEASHHNHLVGPTLHGHDPFKSETEIEVKDGDALFLPGGDYYLTKLKLEKNSTLMLGGSVRIFMPKGKIYVKYGSSVVAAAPDANLLVLIAGKGGVKISKSSRMHGGIYAPHAKLYVKYDSHLYGSAVVDKLKLHKNSSIHAVDVCGGGLPDLPTEPVAPVSDFTPDEDPDDFETDGD